MENSLVVRTIFANVAFYPKQRREKRNQNFDS